MQKLKLVLSRLLKVGGFLLGFLGSALLIKAHYDLTYKVNLLETRLLDVKRSQYEWNRFHQSRYDTVIEAMEALVEHWNEPGGVVTNGEYFSGDWGQFTEPTEPPKK